MSDISIVVADASRMAAIRESVILPGRTEHFTLGSLAAAIESIRNDRPKIVAIDALFVQTPAGSAFMDRVVALNGGITIRLIAHHQGRWVTTSRSGDTLPGASVETLAAQMAAANTRRAPRFRVREGVKAIVENGSAAVVDMSVLGAQLVSVPVLRPNQRIKIGLPDADQVLSLIATVAWSTYEKTRADGEPFYRAGIEFTGAAQQALDEYCRRHCTAQPHAVIR